MAGLLLLTAYLLGSIPAALIVTRAFHKGDIRALGDGNMGAHNVHRVLGWWPSILVAVVDFAKGALAVLLMQAFGFGLAWQLVALACAVFGHDFPIYAQFRGGQGLACTLGGLTALAFVEMAIGLVLYGVIYLITRNADLGAGIGTGFGVFLMGARGGPFLLVAGAIAIILTIPAKMLLDRPRRVNIHQQHTR
jgi:glycerol-3-phosphate acyltransferase PlsY